MQNLYATASTPLDLTAHQQAIDGELAVEAGKVTAFHGSDDFVTGLAAAALAPLSPTASFFVGVLAAATSNGKSASPQKSQFFTETSLSRKEARAKPIPMGAKPKTKQQQPVRSIFVDDILSRAKIAKRSLTSFPGKGITVAEKNIKRLKDEADVIRHQLQGYNAFDNQHRLIRDLAQGSALALKAVQTNRNIRPKSRFAALAA